MFMGRLIVLWTENWITSIGARLGIVQTDADDVHGYNQTQYDGLKSIRLTQMLLMHPKRSRQMRTSISAC